MKKRTSISKDVLLTDLKNRLDQEGIAYTEDNAMSGSVYFRTSKGDIRVADHNENPNKLTNTVGFLYFDNPISRAHFFKTKSDEKDYHSTINIIINRVK